MDPKILPHIYTWLNLLSAIFLVLGFLSIKKGNKETHKKQMLIATCSSAIFLLLYLIYHYSVGHVKYPFHDWTRTVYFVILVPHIILAVIMTPCILTLLFLAWKESFDLHKKLARKVWPVWIYVSVTGVVIYLMLYIQPMFREPKKQSIEAQEPTSSSPAIDEKE
ncbi:MAG: DUF420 domain-containing protein [Lentisphaeria bacterium]|nr:DUF420 domain-containing protein [Lentisphaeria bacterium]NQZ69437.1 DUF420 domain-containing protein [Lentisphaeria bacterium]